MQLKTWTIQNQTGNKAKILNLGARLIHWESQLSNHNNVILGYQNIEDYRNDLFYMGAIAGPYANRIANAQVTTPEGTLNLGANEGEHHLHGGNDGLQQFFWTLVSQSESAIALTYEHTADKKHEGYPGKITFQVTYEVSEAGVLNITIEANADKVVPIGPTGHAYFNIGNFQDTNNSLHLQLNAAQYTPFDRQNLPTGEISDVTETLDFTQAKAVEAVLDHNFVASGSGFRQVARLTSPKTAVSMAVFSDYPGVQVYTADHLGGEHFSRQAICIEPQYYPDAPNQANFPFAYTSPQAPFKKQIQYQLRKT